MSGFANCGSTEKCGYSITSNTTELVKGKHQTPVKHYKDDLTFTLSASGSGCSIAAFSTSEIWYAVLGT